MGRIEYEYPLFKVYYSNNSNNSNIRGNPGAGCCLVAMLYALFMLEESLQLPPGERSSAAADSGGGGVVGSSLLYLLDGLRTVARPRHGHRSDSTVKQIALVLAFTANCLALCNVLYMVHTDGCCCGWGG